MITINDIQIVINLYQTNTVFKPYLTCACISRLTWAILHFQHEKPSGREISIRQKNRPTYAGQAV